MKVRHELELRGKRAGFILACVHSTQQRIRAIERFEHMHIVYSRKMSGATLHEKSKKSRTNSSTDQVASLLSSLSLEDECKAAMLSIEREAEALGALAFLDEDDLAFLDEYDVTTKDVVFNNDCFPTDDKLKGTADIGYHNQDTCESKGTTEMGYDDCCYQSKGTMEIGYNNEYVKDFHNKECGFLQNHVFIEDFKKPSSREKLDGKLVKASSTELIALAEDSLKETRIKLDAAIKKSLLYFKDSFGDSPHSSRLLTESGKSVGKGKEKNISKEQNKHPWNARVHLVDHHLLQENYADAGEETGTCLGTDYQALLEQESREVLQPGWQEEFKIPDNLLNQENVNDQAENYLGRVDIIFTEWNGVMRWLEKLKEQLVTN